MISNWADKLTAVAVATQTNSQSVPSADATALLRLDAVESEKQNAIEVDLTNDAINVLMDGNYWVCAQVGWQSDSGWSTGDFAAPNVNVNGDGFASGEQRKISTGGEIKRTPVAGELQRGDAITVNTYQDSGASKLTKGLGVKTKVMVVRLGDQ